MKKPSSETAPGAGAQQLAHTKLALARQGENMVKYATPRSKTRRTRQKTANNNKQLELHNGNSQTYASDRTLCGNGRASFRG